MKHYLDRFGQLAKSSWPGKIKHEQYIKRSAIEEEAILAQWKPQPDIDAFGGYTKSWHVRGTGFYRILKRKGAWWLISPLGNPLFYTGICASPGVTAGKTPITGREKLFDSFFPKSRKYKELWGKDIWREGKNTVYYSLTAANLFRKYGSDWQDKAVRNFEKRVRSWGFTGQGKWCAPVKEMPRVVVLEFPSWPRVNRHPDVFDPKVVKEIKQQLAKRIKPYVNDPYIVGWSIGNEYDEIIPVNEIRAIFSSRSNRPIDRALARWIDKPNPSPADVEAARRFYADRYYATLFRLMKELAPNHLYFGFWIVPDWWQNHRDWDLSAKYCDVIGYDRYSIHYKGIEYLLAKSHKPTLLGEFSFPAWYEGKRGFGRYPLVSVQTDKESGHYYGKLLQNLGKDPKCIGALWFEYRDQPITGRGPGSGSAIAIGENFAFGTVDIADRPKWELVKQMRSANLRVTPDRLRHFS